MRRIWGKYQFLCHISWILLSHIVNVDWFFCSCARISWNSTAMELNYKWRPFPPSKCAVCETSNPPLPLSNYTRPSLKSFHCYNELWLENVTISHNLRMSFCFLSRWDEWRRQGIQEGDLFNDDTRNGMKDHVASRANNICIDMRGVIYLYGENHFICINAMGLSKGSPWRNGLKIIRWTF